jgi:TonB-dependent SusC/RagA subfamily outer membrane receptor
LKSIILLLISTAGFAQQRLHTVYTHPVKSDISITCFTPENYPQVNPVANTPGKFRFQCRVMNSSIPQTEPLYFVDGKLVDTIGSPLNSISPESIKSIDILKDEEAIALYGPKAAGGAIFITTKSAKHSEKKHIHR